MKALRFSIAALAMAALAGGFAAHSATAQEAKAVPPGLAHEHESMEKVEKKIGDALSKLSAEDQKLAAAQRFCPMMTYSRLGAMGAPLKVVIEGKPVFLCCKGCLEDAQKRGAATVKTVEKLRSVTAELAKLPKAERMAAEAQKYCAINSTGFLGSMGAPIKLMIEGKPVYLCCAGCTAKAQANPAAALAKAEELKHAGTKDDHDHADQK